MDARLRRANKEIKACNEDVHSGIKIEHFDSSPFHLKASFPGPWGTPYEGGIFEVDIILPELYPFQPLQIKFITKVYHPSVYPESGAICLNILQDHWSPALTIRTTLISLQALLSSPEPSDSVDTTVSQHYMRNKDSFDKTARDWTLNYATGVGKGKTFPTRSCFDSGVEKGWGFPFLFFLFCVLALYLWTW